MANNPLHFSWILYLYGILKIHVENGGISSCHP
jgi:hypothetical protein